MKNYKSVSAEEALKVVRSGNRIYLHGMAAVPQELVRGLVAHGRRLKNVEIVQLHTEGPAPYAAPEYAESFRVKALFVGANVRDAIKEGRADYVPVFLSEIPSLLQHTLPIDIALIQVSPPDKHGFCSLGTSIEGARAAVLKAHTVIAQVNKHMPRTHGDGIIHISDIKSLVDFDCPLPEHGLRTPSEADKKIGAYCAGLVDNGATLQMGIGAIPDAVLLALKNHKNLGVHTEMFSDGLIDLVECGVVNGSCKRIHPGKIVATFVVGSQKTYDFIDDNPVVAMLDVGYVNDTHVIRRNPKVTAINSAIEIDITGQVCADSIGTRIYSGIGGQMDFMRGASLSEGGKPIIALPSTTKLGETRIVPYLKEGAGVVTTRGHVQYVVTEFGVAYLYGKGLRDRAKALIEIAHPDHREYLDRMAADRFATGKDFHFFAASA
jgi:acyl-CoA hydrolase